MPTHTAEQLQEADLQAVDSKEEVAGVQEKTKTQKGTPSELITPELGLHCNVNNTIIFDGKEKGKQSPITRAQIDAESIAVYRRWVDYEMRRAQDRDVVARAKPEMSGGPSF